MKQTGQFILVLIVFSLLGRTVVTAVYPSAIQFRTTPIASLSDWGEEPVEEDESGDDDKALHEFQTFVLADMNLSSGEIPRSLSLLDFDQEIVVPPPQG
jgi:hypothetical protein